MIIETIYNMGDEVWTMSNNVPKKGKIVDYSFDRNYSKKKDEVTPLDKIIGWELDIKEHSFAGSYNISRLENQLFKTKEELIASL